MTADDMKLLKALSVRIEPVGSRVTCFPPPMDTDADYLVLVESHDLFRSVIAEIDFVMGGSAVLDANVPLDSADRFSSYTKGIDNLIVTQDASFFEKFMVATRVAKHLNLLSKPDRILLFQAVLYSTCHLMP